jgi:type I restriction enzyme R subunit
MRNAVDDYFYDVLRDQKQINLPPERMDDIDMQIMNLARARFPG